MTTVKEALDEIRSVIPKVVWIGITQKSDEPKLPDNAEGFEGHSIDGWRLLIVVWMDGSHPDVGTASKGGLILILPPELANLAGETIRKIERFG